MFNFRKLKSLFQKRKTISIVNLRTGEYTVSESGFARPFQKNNFLYSYNHSWNHRNEFK